MAARPSGSRRILRSLPTNYIVAKGQQQMQQQPLQGNQIKIIKNLNGPITRFWIKLSTRNHVDGKVAGEEEDVKETRTESSKRKRNRFPEEQEKESSATMQKKHEEQESQKKKLKRQECDGSSDSSRPTETAESALDGKEDQEQESQKKELERRTLDGEEDLHEMCEVEMEEVKSPLRSIDKSDSRNPLAVVEYVNDIYSFYRKTEITGCVPIDYMSIQSDINHNMRAELIDWLIEVHHELDLLPESLFLAINLIDRYLSRQHVLRKCLQLVGITGMLLACKYEEVCRPCRPLLDDFLYLCDGAYTTEDVLEMEKSMLNTLQFNLSVPTPFVFMRRLLKAAKFDTKLEMASFYLMELSMVDYQMLKFPPSLLSAAAIYTGNCILRRTPAWDKTLAHYSTYSKCQLHECVRFMVGLHQKADQGRLMAVFKKYSFSKYSYIAILMKKSAEEILFHLKVRRMSKFTSTHGTLAARNSP